MSAYNTDFVTLICGRLSMICRSKSMKNNVEEIAAYVMFLFITYLIKSFITDHWFSSLLTLSAAVQGLGFCLLWLQIRKNGHVQGISSRSISLYLVAYMSRLFSTLRYNGYLPIDRTGDWVYQALDVAALFVVCSLLWDVNVVHSKSYEADLDTCNCSWFLALCTCLAYLVHPDLNNSWVADAAWTLALYVESIAMVPQLFMLTKKGGEVDGLLSHYIALIFLSRCLTIVFWGFTYGELRRQDHLEDAVNWPGYAVMAAQLLQVVIFGDFMWLYARHFYLQRKLVLPTEI
jgi:hypothetical protein